MNAQATYSAAAAGGRELTPLTSIPLGPVERSILAQRGFGSVLGDVLTSAFPTWTFGVTVSYPLGTSSAEANLARARLQHSQAETQLKKLELQIATQVRDLARQVQTNQKRVDSARAARELAERRLEAEEKKFAAGIQTSFFVFQAQRDLAQARTNEIRADLRLQQVARRLRGGAGDRRCGRTAAGQSSASCAVLTLLLPSARLPACRSSRSPSSRRTKRRTSARALESVAWADEIIVVDSESTDDTVAIARRFTDRVIVRPWPGYVAQKNHAASLATHDWILSLDADERVTPALAEEIQATLAQTPAHAAFRMPRVTWHLGRWIRTTDWYPDHQMRLYDRRSRTVDRRSTCTNR